MEVSEFSLGSDNSLSAKLFVPLISKLSFIGRTKE